MIGLAIPMLNEEQNVQPVLEEICTVLTTAKIPFKIAAVNNGSSDGTHAKIIELAQQNPNIIPIHLPVNQQYGGGILAGMRTLESENPSVIGWMWGDGQISPHVLPDLIDHLQQSADAAKIYRTKRHDGWQRWMISRLYAMSMKKIGLSIKDINGCPKIFRNDALEALKLSSTDWFIDAEAMLKAKNLGFVIQKEPAIMSARKGGYSKVNWKTCIEFVRNIRAWNKKR